MFRIEMIVSCKGRHRQCCCTSSLRQQGAAERTHSPTDRKLPTGLRERSRPLRVYHTSPLTPSGPRLLASALFVVVVVYLEAVVELLGDEVEYYGIDAGVDGRHVDAEVVEQQQEAAPQKKKSVSLKGSRFPHFSRCRRF